MPKHGFKILNLEHLMRRKGPENAFWTLHLSLGQFKTLYMWNDIVVYGTYIRKYCKTVW